MKPGYKLSSVGVIPADWDAKRLSDLTDAIGDGIHTTPEYVMSSDFFFINGNNLNGNAIEITETTKCVSQAEFVKLQKQLDDSSILMSINGTIGNLAYYRNESVVLGKSAAYINVAQQTAREFVYYCLQSSATRRYFGYELTGTTIGNLSLKSLRNTPIPVPRDKMEQRAIAAALSDVDSLLSALDKLIAKKRDIKQGAMQELLTGKKQLSKPRKVWELRRLEDISDTLRGSSLAKSDIVVSGSQTCILYGELFTIYGRVIGQVVSSTNVLAGVRSRRGDVLIPGSTTTVGIDLAVASALMLDNVLLGGDINIIRGKQSGQYVPEFLAYYITEVLRSSISELAQGTTIVHIYGKDLSKLLIRLPEIGEQQAIIDIITDMDAEIAALEQKRDKTRALKQGMMQQLLTGQIRLI